MGKTVAAGRSDSPAGALGPTAFVLGVFSVAGAWVPVLVGVLWPWAVLAGALAVTFGAAGIHQAARGVGRLWTAVAGTVLGAAGFGAVIALLVEFGA